MKAVKYSMEPLRGAMERAKQSMKGNQCTIGSIRGGTIQYHGSTNRNHCTVSVHHGATAFIQYSMKDCKQSLSVNN